MIDRKAAHELLDLLIDAIEREESANDPDSGASAEAEAVGAFAALSQELMGPIFALRRGVELSGLRRPGEATSAGARATADRETLVTTGSRGVPASDFNKESGLTGDAAAAMRTAIGQSLLDAELAGIVQKGVGTALNMIFEQANLGAAMYGDVLWPKRKRGESIPDTGFAGLTAVARQIYYIAGYRDQGVKPTFDEWVKSADRGIQWEAFRKRRDRAPNLRAMLEKALADGKADREAGRPDARPHGDFAPSALADLYLGHMA